MSNERKNRIYCMGSLIETFIDQKSAIQLIVYNFSKPTSSWTPRDKFVLNTENTDLTVEDVGTFEDSDSGIIKPYIFVHSALSDAYFLLSVLRNKGSWSKTRNKLSAICQLQGAKAESWISKSFKVVDGKLLVWHCKTRIHVGFTNDKKETSFRRQSFPVNSAESEFTDLSIVSTVADDCEIFIFIKCVCKSKQSDEQDLVPSEETRLQVLMLKQNVDGIWINTEIDSTKFLPREYASGILDMKVTIQHRMSPADTGGDIASVVVLLLEGGYVVELKNGCLLRCCFVDDNIVLSPKKWKLVDVFDGTRCILRTSDTDVTVVDLEKGKVIHTWSDVSSCTVGDFLQYGRPQLLIIFEDSSDEEIRSWLLTDFAGCEIDSRNIPGQEEDRGEAERQKARAAEALYNTLQSSTANLCEAEQHLANKVKFLHNTWQQLHQRSRGGEATLQKPEVPLVTLVDKLPKDRSAVGGHMNKGLDLVSKVAWKTTVGSQLIIGVDVHNTTDKVLSQCSLSLVPHTKLAEPDVKASFSKWPPNHLPKQTTLEGDLHPSLAKRLKLDSDIILPTNKQEDISLKPSDRVTLTVSTDLSVAGFQDGFKVWVFLNAREKSSAVTESGDHLGCEEMSELRTLCCGLVFITTQEFLQGSLAVSLDFSCSSGQDLNILHASLSAVQMRTGLEVTATFTDLTQLLSILQSQTSFRLVPDLDCLCSVTCPPLHFVRIQRPQIISRNLVYMSVWTRDVNQLHLAVQHLSSHLPDDIMISQHNDCETSNSVSAAWSHLSDEMKTVSMATRTLLNESSQYVKSALSSSSNSSLSEVKPDQVGELRKSFSEQQMAVQKLEEGQMNPHKVKVMRDLISRTQIKTDESVASLKCAGF